MSATNSYNETVSETFVASSDWTSVGPRAHSVQFYPNDGYLLDLLTRFVGSALVSGDVAIVAATKAHREGLGTRLRARGFDLRVPRDEGRYIALDARATLAKITREGRVDRALFHDVVGASISRVSNRGERPRIAVFGELVAVLWADGKHDSAIRLEEMWNDLAREHAFALWCAYPMNGFGNGHAAPFMKICAQHSHVFTVATAAASTRASLAGDPPQSAV